MMLFHCCFILCFYLIMNIGVPPMGYVSYCSASASYAAEDVIQGTVNPLSEEELEEGDNNDDVSHYSYHHILNRKLGKKNKNGAVCTASDTNTCAADAREDSSPSGTTTGAPSSPTTNALNNIDVNLMKKKKKPINAPSTSTALADTVSCCDTKTSKTFWLPLEDLQDFLLRNNQIDKDRYKSGTCPGYCSGAWAIGPLTYRFGPYSKIFLNTYLDQVIRIIDDDGELRDQVGYVTFSYGVNGNNGKLSASITLINGYVFGNSGGGRGLASLYGSTVPPELGPYTFPFQKDVQNGWTSYDFVNVSPRFCEQSTCTNSIFIALYIEVCETRKPTRAPTPRPTPRPAPTTRSPTQRQTPSPTSWPTNLPTTRSPTNLPTTRAPTIRPTKSPTDKPTARPTKAPTDKPTDKPTITPTTRSPTKLPTTAPSKNPTKTPTRSPSPLPTTTPTRNPTRKPTKPPSKQPTKTPTKAPSTPNPTKDPTVTPTKSPTNEPTQSPSQSPTKKPLPPITDAPTISPTTRNPTKSPSSTPTTDPTGSPSTTPTKDPTKTPTKAPSNQPTSPPTKAPSTKSPTKSPSEVPTRDPTKRPSKSPSKLPSKNPTRNPTTASPTKNPTALPTRAPSNLPTTKPTQPPTLQGPTKNPTKFPTNSPTEKPETEPPTQRQRILDFDSLDLFLIMDRSNSVTYYTTLCQQAPTTDGVSRNCWKLNMNSAIELILAIADDMGWADSCKPKPKCGLRVAAYAFACSSNQINPITIPIIKELAGSESEVIPPLQNAYDNMNPNAGTCPERALENVVMQIEENWPIVTKRPYKASLIFTDGILYNGQRNDNYPFKLSDAIRKLCGATFAFAVGIGADQLSPEFKEIQQRDLLQLAGTEKTIIDLNNGQDSAFTVFVKTMNVIMTFVDNLPQCTSSRYVFDNPQCLFETKGVCENTFYCKWIERHPVTNKVACVPKSFCNGFIKSQCDSDVFCVWGPNGCVAKSTLSSQLSCCCMEQARCELNKDRCVWKKNKCDAKIELRIPVIEE